ncbi:twitching motility protein PilT [Sorangium cellulosum]|uniref:Ribonuclease VapC n=1 Tax=Sorangium cellulosum TaxID=56 RepID=A0A4P2Q9A5_SORCE|nr:type II toxin-antitoxin system VapC family toxin [Sorangium cellulosum]AUX25788.1 twitching motility protein PilT [Sorangium cellulosum]
MILRFLLDTNIVSAPVSIRPDPEIVRRIEQHAHECAIGAPVWHELVYGCRRLPRGRRRTALEAYLEEVVRASFPILAYDEAAAAWHGAERARLEELGAAAPYVDGQIAAIARTKGLTLVTANTKDFTRFSELDVEDWSRRRRR